MIKRIIMNKKQFQLSAIGLRNIVSYLNSKYQVVIYNADYKNIDINEEEFLFALGKRAIKMNKFLAIFISPRVSSLLFIDPTVQTLYLDDFGYMIPDFETFKNSEILDTMKSIICGQKIEIDFQESRNLLILSILFGNSDQIIRVIQI